MPPKDMRRDMVETTDQKMRGERKSKRSDRSKIPSRGTEKVGRARDEKRSQPINFPGSVTFKMGARALRAKTALRVTPSAVTLTT